MASKATKPPGMASQGGLELHCQAASAVREDSAPPAYFQVDIDARRAVAEMVANGAVFHVRCRENGNPDFIFELPHGGDLSRCRRIIAEMKAAPIGVWREFLEAIVENAGGPAR